MVAKTYDYRYNMAGDRMKETGLIDKSIDFGVRIVKLHRSLLKTKHEVTQPHFGAQRRYSISRLRRRHHGHFIILDGSFKQSEDWFVRTYLESPRTFKKARVSAFSLRLAILLRLHAQKAPRREGGTS